MYQPRPNLTNAEYNALTTAQRIAYPFKAPAPPEMTQAELNAMQANIRASHPTPVSRSHKINGCSVAIEPWYQGQIQQQGHAVVQDGGKFHVHDVSRDRSESPRWRDDGRISSHRTGKSAIYDAGY